MDTASSPCSAPQEKLRRAQTAQKCLSRSSVRQFWLPRGCILKNRRLPPKIRRSPSHCRSRSPPHLFGKLWFYGIGVEKMSHFRLAHHETVDPLLQLTIRFYLALVLTLMFGPRMDQEYLHKAIGYLEIAIDTPLICAI